MDIIRHETRRRSGLVGRERSEDSDLEVKACSGFASGWLAGACVQANASERPFPPSAACSDSAFPLSSQRVLDVPQTVSPCEYSPLYPLRIMIDSAMQSSCCMHSPAPIALDEGSLQPHIRVKRAMHFSYIIPSLSRRDGWHQN